MAFESIFADDTANLISGASAAISLLALLANIVFFLLTRAASSRSGKLADLARTEGNKMIAEANALKAEANQMVREANSMRAEANVLRTVANEHSAKLSTFTGAQLEANLAAQIQEARARMEDVHRDLVSITQGKTKLNAAETRQVESLKLNLKSLAEAFLSQYDLGCRLYIDSKVDRGSFKRTYFNAIREFCTNREAKATFDLLHPRDGCPFEALWKVYDEWHTLEK